MAKPKVAVGGGGRIPPALAGGEPPEEDGPTDPPALAIAYGHELGRKYDLHAPHIDIGTAPDSYVRLADADAAARHARVHLDHRGVTLEDLGSGKPTLVDGAVVSTAALRGGETLTVGRTKLRVLMGADIERQYHEFIFELSSIDGLTGILNRRMFLLFVAEELRRAGVEKTPVALFIVDVDDMAQFNDDHGHRAGDALLAHIAHELVQALPVLAILGRVRGEEFGVALPRHTPDQARACVAEVTRRLAARQFVFEGRPRPFAVSTKLVEAGEEATAEDLVEAARLRPGCDGPAR